MPDTLDALDTAEIGTAVVEGLQDVTVRKVLAAVIAAAICIVIAKVLMAVVNRAVERTRLDISVKKLIRGMIRGVLYFVAAIVVLGILGIPVTSLVAVLSVAGLALSLALQNFLSNVAGGVQIFASQPFKPGDWVDAGGCSGTVDEIGLFYTKLKGIDNRLIQLPNSTVVSGNIINYTAEPLRRVELKISASYDSDPALVLNTLTDMVSGHPLTLTDPKPFVHVLEYRESDIQYIARVWCKNEDYWTIYFDLMDEMKAVFDKVGVEITYPHLNVHMVEQ